MKGVMLDLGSDVNILPNKSWEQMKNPSWYGLLLSSG